MICGGRPGPENLPAVGDGSCCFGAATMGPDDCTCWEPVHDLEQTAPDVDGQQVVRPDGMCGNCAYRPDSPEKNGHPNYRGDATDLEIMAESGRPFYCHDGLRRRVGWLHPPTGTWLPVSIAEDYDPPTRGGVAYRTDGAPAYRCAGWDARRRALAAAAKSG